jgi:hypothetical protein
MSSPITFTVVPADTYVFLKPVIDPAIQSKIISMEVLYNDDNSVRTAFWKKHEVTSAEIAISSVKVPIAPEDRSRKWTFILVLTYVDNAGKYITIYSDRSPLVALIKAPPVIHLSPIDNDTNRSTGLEDSYDIDASFMADSLDSIDGIHLVLYDDSDDLGVFRKIIFSKQDGTSDFFIDGDTTTTAYTPVKNMATGNYEVKLLIGNLDLKYAYEIAAVSLFKMLFSEISNTVFFSPDKVPYLKKLMNKKQDITVQFDVDEGDVEVGFNMYSPGVPAENSSAEELNIYIETYTDAQRQESDLLGTGKKSLLSAEKPFEYYDDTNKDTGNQVTFSTESVSSEEDSTKKLFKIGEINYLRIYVENSYGKSRKFYDIEFQPIKREAAPVLQISEIVADSKAIKIRWTPPVISNKNEISTWKVIRSEVSGRSGLSQVVIVDVPNTDENKENGDFIYTFQSLEVDKKYFFTVKSLINNQFNFDTWNVRRIGMGRDGDDSDSISQIFVGKSSDESFGVAYDTYQAPTVTADTTPVNSDGKCILSVGVSTLPNSIQIDSIETEYTGSDGSSGTRSTTYNSSGTVVSISELSNSVVYTFKVFVVASLKPESLSNTVPTQTNGIKSEPLTFRPWKRVAIELEFNGTDDSGSFGLKFLRQIITGSGNTNVTDFISSNGKLKLEWRQPYSENEIKSGFKEFMPQQIPLLTDANILPNFLTFVKATLTFPNLNDSTETISADSYETVAVRSGAYTPSNLTFDAEPNTGDSGAVSIKWENPVFDGSNLFNSADNLNKNSLVGFELKRYSEEDLDFISLPSTTGYRLLTNVSDAVSNRSVVTPLNPATLGGLAGPTEMTPAIAALKYDGWYFKKIASATSGSTSKINWTFYPESTIKVSDLKRIFFKFKVINKTNAPFINVYTKPTGTGDASANFYKSRRTYDLININPVLPSNALVNNEDYFCYVNFNGETSVPVPDRHITRLLRISDTTANKGAFASTEEVGFIAFSTNSAAAANSVEFIVRSLSLQSTGKTETFSFSNIISGVFDKDIDTTGKVYEYKYNYQAAELGKNKTFMVEAIYSNTIETRAPAIGMTMAYKLPDAPSIIDVTSVDLKTLEIKITPPTQLGGGSNYGYLVKLKGTDQNGADVPTSDRTIVWQDLADKTVLRISGLTSNVQYVPTIKTLINLKTPLGEYIQSSLSLAGPARYCLHSEDELKVSNFRISKNGFNLDDSITADQLGASVELKWDAIVDGGYIVTYVILQVDVNGVQLIGSVDTLVDSTEATTTKVLNGLKFISGLSNFVILARIANINTVDPIDSITGPPSRTSGHLYDTVTEAVKNLSVVAGDRNVGVSWDLIIQSARNTNVANYRVYFWLATGSININDPNSYVQVSSTVKTATISNLTNGTEYKIAVLYSLVEDPATYFSPDNGYLINSATPFGAPSAATISADITVGIKQAAITVTTESTANGSAVFKYNIYRKISTASSFSLLGSFTKVNGVLTYVDTNVAVSSAYDYYVRPVYKNTNNNVDIEGPQSNTVRKIIFVKFAVPSQALTFQAISESDFTINFKSLKDELAISSNSSASTGFVQNIVSTGLFGLIKIPVLDAKLQIACTYTNGQQAITVTKEYANSISGNSNNDVNFSDLRGANPFASGTICALTVSLLGKNPNNSQYVASDSVPVQFQPFGKPTFNTFRTFNGIRNVAVKVIADPTTTNYNFGVFSVFKCKVFVGYNGFLNNNGYSNFSSAELTSASGLFSYAIKDSDLTSSNPNRNFKFVITMETVGTFPAINRLISNDVNVIVSSESSGSPDPVVVVKESFYYSSDQSKAYVKVDTSYAPLVSLIAIFRLASPTNTSNLELYVDSRYPVLSQGVLYQVKDISSDAENLEDKLIGISTFEIPLVGFTSSQVVDFILLVATTSGVSRPYFVTPKSNNALAFGKSDTVYFPLGYFPPGTDLSSIVRPPL